MSPVGLPWACWQWKTSLGLETGPFFIPPGPVSPIFSLPSSFVLSTDFSLDKDLSFLDDLREGFTTPFLSWVEELLLLELCPLGGGTGALPFCWGFFLNMIKVWEPQLIKLTAKLFVLILF